MFKRIGAVLVATAILFSGGAASASSVSPAGSVKLTFVTRFKHSIDLLCANTFDGTVNTLAGTIVVATIGKPLGTTGLCAATIFTSNVALQFGTFNPVNNSAPIAVTNINMATPVGSCAQGSASVSGVWLNGSPGQGTILASVPGNAMGVPTPCVLIIQMTSTPDLSVY